MRGRLPIPLRWHACPASERATLFKPPSMISADCSWARKQPCEIGRKYFRESAGAYVNQSPLRQYVFFEIDFAMCLNSGVLNGSMRRTAAESGRIMAGCCPVHPHGCGKHDYFRRNKLCAALINTTAPATRNRAPKLLNGLRTPTAIRANPRTSANHGFIVAASVVHAR